MEQVTLSVADGTKMQAYVARPKTKPTAGIIVLQEAFGVNHHIQDVTKRFADAGYLAIAPEVFHRTAPAGFVAGYDQFPAVMPHYSAVTEESMKQDVQACFDWLTKAEHCQVAASVGYCLGGRISFVANASVPLTCAISYYGGGIAQGHLALAPAQKSPLLFFWGGLDQHITQESVQQVNQALTTANKKFTCVTISDADHGFFCNDKPVFNPVASKQAWALTLEFLKEYNVAGKHA